MRQRFTAEQWAKWLEEFDRSDLSSKAFCQRRGVSENTTDQLSLLLGGVDLRSVEHRKRCRPPNKLR